MHIIPDTILRAVCWTLLHSLWQGLIVALLAGIIMVLTKRSSSSLRYNLLCGLLFLFLGVSGYTFYRELPPAVSISAASATPSSVVSPAAAALIPAAAAVAQPSAAPAASAVVQSGIDRLIQYFNTHAALVVLIWFIIFLGRFVQLLSALVYAQRIRYYQISAAPAEWHQRLQELLRKVRITRPVLLLESTLIKVPVVVGFLKPAILVPVGMLAHISPDQVESILLHELAHIRRQDYLFNLVQNVVDTLFFFNPAMIWISSLIRTERENCCDDIAIRETRSRRRLIEALVSFHEYEQTAGGYALSFAAKENQVVRRVKRIVHKKNHSLNAGERVLLTTGLLILCAAFVTIKSSRVDAPVKAPHSASVVKTPPAASKNVTTTKVKPALVRGAEAARQDPAAPFEHAMAPVQDPAVPVEHPATPIHDTTPKAQKPIDLFQNVSVDKLIEAKEHGVSVEFIKELQQMGYKDLTIDQAIQLKDHGVDADFIRDIQKMGYTDMPLDKAVKLRDHGVDPDFIRSIRALGFEHFSLDNAIFAKDHGVTPDYIAGIKKRMGRLFELNDYVKLRDAGIGPDTYEEQ